MPITFDAANSNSGSSTNSVTVALTISGIERLICACIVAVDLTPGNRIVSSAKWNTTETLSAIQGLAGHSASTSFQYQLVNPTAGSHNLVVTTAGTCIIIGVAVISLNGVDQSSPVDSFNFNSGNAVESAVNWNTVLDNTFGIDMHFIDSLVAQTPGAGQTQRFVRPLSTRDFFGGTEPLGLAGLKDMKYTLTTGLPPDPRNFVALATAFAPSTVTSRVRTKPIYF